MVMDWAAAGQHARLVPLLFTHDLIFHAFLPHLAGSKAASWVGPKIVLDHVRVYICVCALDFLTIGCIQCY